MWESFPPARERTIKFGFRFGSFGKLSFSAFVQHGDDGANDLEMAEFLGRDIEQHVAAPRVFFAHGLGEVPARRREFPLGTAELLEQEVGQTGVG